MPVHHIFRGMLFALAAAFAGSSSNAEEADRQTAVFAGGCFWCVEADLEKLDGVGDVVSGYAGGELQNPTYENHEGHLEVVEAPFDPNVISYRDLVDYFLRHIDPLDDGGQFCDRGHSYTTAIFYADEAQRKDAEEAVAAAEEDLGKSIVTPVRLLNAFWVAEGYHQDYYKKNPVRYQFYRTSCGRDRRVNAVWGK
jgi:peptide-methionine (S)-S-oxide reductase